MEKIRLNDGIVFDIQPGNTENSISIVADSIDSVANAFTDSNLERYEILTESGDVSAIYTKKYLKRLRADVIDEGGYLVTVGLKDVDELYERLATLEATVDSLVNEQTEEVVEEVTETEEV